MKIILYDIPSSIARKAWSPNTWKTRYCLNYKGIPYRTEWVEYPDIEELYTKMGLPPFAFTPDGTPRYTLPVIHDPSRGVNLNESFAIAQYLDREYPHTPPVFPSHSAGILAPFAGAVSAQLKPIWNFLVPPELEILSTRSAVWFKSSREKFLGVERLEDVTPRGEERVREWRKVEKGFGKIDGWYSMNVHRGQFIWGVAPCWADFVVGGYLMWARSTAGEESKEWKDIMSWNNGRWKALVEGLKKYEEVN